jgi:S-adenosylmethionine hydrolase
MHPLALSFLTDYGHQDSYAGVLHAVALSRLSPQAKQATQLFDLTHGIPAFDIRAGAWSLLQALPYLPAHSVHVSIVDPYVGNPSQQVALLYRSSFQQVFIAPDNGLLNPLLSVMPDAQVFCFKQQDLHPYGWAYANAMQSTSAGKTFQGRDLYVPLACHILNTWARNELPFFLEEDQAYQTSLTVESPFPPVAYRQNDVIKAHALLQDAFGNWITTIPSHWIPQNISQIILSTADKTVALPVADYFAKKGLKFKALAIRGSHGFIEIASFKSNPYLDLERDREISITVDEET